jgi:O-antigen ligase
VDPLGASAASADKRGAAWQPRATHAPPVEPDGFARRAAEGIWLCLLVLLPAAFNPTAQLAFEPLKTSLLRIGAVVIGTAWLWSRLQQQPRVDVWAQPLVRTGVVLVALAAVSTALSLTPLLSLFGSFDRGMGWLNLAAGGILLVSAADLFAEERRRERAITALVLGAVLPCTYFLLQRVGLDPVQWTTRGTPGSSLGSPTFLGGYLVLVAPFAAYRTLMTARRASLAYAGWLALLLVICAITLLAAIRGPILGLAAGVVTFAIAARGRRKLARVEVGGALGLLVVAIALAVVTMGRGGTQGLQRFLTIAQSGDSSMERLRVWGESVRLPLAEPGRILIGYGLESQAAVLERSEAVVRWSPNEQWDRAHNVILDTWLTGGLFGAGALALVFATAFRHAIGASPGQRLIAAALVGALVGHLVEVSFAFETVVTGAVFWAVLGLASSLSPRFVERAAARRSVPVLATAAALVLVLPLAAPAIADALYGSARRASYEVGAQREELAAAWAPWIEELPRVAGLDWQQVATRRSDDAAAARAEVDLQEAARRSALDPVPRLRLVRLYLNRDELDKAERECQLAFAVGPFRPNVWAACGDVAARRGLTDEAAARRARAEALRQQI